MTTLGARIRAARLLRGQSQAQLAKEVGISASSVSYSERMLHREVHPETIVKVAKHLGLLPLHPQGEKSGAQRGKAILIPASLSALAEHHHLTYTQVLDLVHIYEALMERLPGLTLQLDRLDWNTMYMAVLRRLHQMEKPDASH